jgi:hypothetical protein
MFAYVLAVLSRYAVVSHMAWLNFTAVGGSLLYFGARRSWREMLAPLAVLMVCDYCLTTYVYHFAFRWQDYTISWTWYVAAMALGWILLHGRVSFLRGAVAALLGPTSFFVVSNFGVWASGFNGYPHTLAGLATCYWAAIPFYRNDLLSTSIVLAAAFGLPALAHHWQFNRALNVAIK